ncbi:MAG: type II toxin-antitoxin system HicB family antitoxin [Chloroflexota bacterium]|nr:type II toxin-antitoxin system HicB family antitoxin [Chloroflexota bacterium]
MRYRIEIERGSQNFSAYSPDVDGCVATGATEDECRQNMADALAFHFDGMLRQGLPLPQPRPSTDLAGDSVEVSVHAVPVPFTT